ncbi:MAG: ATP-dependent DNA ligase [Micrococcales bacterium]|nr:ATP-dependent DNA ligase [Micrococcales bacterium]
MGRLTYDGIVSADFDDRLLAHLQLVIGTKLRRGEAFHFSWRDDDSIGDGRTIVWVHPRASLAYKFFGSRPPEINPTWVDALMMTANSATGLRVIPEPSAHRHPGQLHAPVSHLTAQ